MSSSRVHLSTQSRQALLDKLDAHTRADNGCNGQTSNTETDSELALRSILESNRFSTEDEVQDAVQEYINGKPLAYITGQHRFGDLDLSIRPPVYIPRVETEQWVLLLAESILSHTPPNRTIRILDICSGSGCIPLLLAKRGQGRIHTVGLEYDEATLSIARENITRNKLESVSSFEQFDIFQDTAALRERLGEFDMVISNPPYVSSSDMKEVEGRWYEGKLALQGKLKEDKAKDDDDGYSFYRRILRMYMTFLSPTRPREIPKLVLEVGAKQSQTVQDIYEGQGRVEIQRETERRRDIATPKLEADDMVGTERSLWIYD